MVSSRLRHGRSKLGCLFVLLIASAAIYFGVNVGELYLRAYRFEDAMRQEARFAGVNSDVVIRRRLAATADTLGLPEAAANVRVRRRGRSITLESEYYEHVELPLYVREVRFRPRAEATF